jgi:hypothetical protein
MKDISAEFMKVFFKKAFILIGIPSALLLGLAAIGIKTDYTDIDIILKLSVYAPLLFMLLILFIGVQTTEQIVAEDRKRAALDFYSVDTNAAIDRAFRKFWHLLEEGRRWRKATVQQRQDWDLKVIAAMRQYCNEATRNIYLLNTGRYDPALGHLIKDDKYDLALEHIEEMLRRDFERDLLVN